MLRQLASTCWAETLLITGTKADRALGPLLPTSAWEHWSFFVLHDSLSRSCTGSARFSVNRFRTLDWRLSPPLRPVRLIADGSCIDAEGDGTCCVNVLLRVQAIHSPLSCVCAEMVLEAVPHCNVRMLCWKRGVSTDTFQLKSFLHARCSSRPRDAIHRALIYPSALVVHRVLFNRMRNQQLVSMLVRRFESR